MKVGLVFLAGLLAGGLAVAWVVAEMPAAEPAAALGAPPIPAAPRPGDAVVAGEPRDLLPVAPPAETPPVPVFETTSSPTQAGIPEPQPVPVPVPEGAGAPLLPPLRIPVQGVEAGALVDSFADARGGDRVHEALDIMAPEGTPVLAVADGPVVKLFDSVPGGLTLYQFDEAGQVAFYYAHMRGYAEGVEEGRMLRQGEVLGYVGHTGNASTDAPHLHFAIFVLGPEKNWWQGEAINPYPLFAPAGSSQGPAD